MFQRKWEVLLILSDQKLCRFLQLLVHLRDLELEVETAIDGILPRRLHCVPIPNPPRSTLIVFAQLKLQRTTSFAVYMELIPYSWRGLQDQTHAQEIVDPPAIQQSRHS